MRRLDTSKVSTLRIANCDEAQLSALACVMQIQSCPNLTDLELKSLQCVDDEVIRELQVTMLKQLKRVSFQCLSSNFTVDCAVWQSIIQISEWWHCMLRRRLLRKVLRD